jgi:hypothetical protein
MPFFWKHVHSNIFDVFVGNGWDCWTRIRVGRQFTNVIGGNRIPYKTLQEVVNSINA